MSDRTIFPNLSLFKQAVTERFLLVLREIFKNHPIYVYDDDDIATKVFIYPSFADIEAPGKKPKIIAKPGGYEFSLMDTLLNNMAGEALNAQGVVGGFRYNKMMTTSMTLMIQAYAEEEATTIGDELAGLIVFACRKMFSQIGLIIRGVQVSETDMIDASQNIYQTVVAVGLEYPWGGQITDETPATDNTVDTGVDLPTGDALRTPGIEIFRQRIAQMQT